jgi:Leucine-rich repeat (LRR) protein
LLSGKSAALSLYNNNLSGNIPLELTNLPNLYELNEKQPVLPAVSRRRLDNLTNLSTLDLSRNQFTAAFLHI